jgi:hypothetical protein
MVKAGLPEAQSPEDATPHPPERRLKPAPALRQYPIHADACRGPPRLRAGTAVHPAHSLSTHRRIAAPGIRSATSAKVRPALCSRCASAPWSTFTARSRVRYGAGSPRPRIVITCPSGRIFHLQRGAGGAWGATDGRGHGHRCGWSSLGTVQLHRLLAAILRAQADQQLDLPVLVVGLLRVAVPAELWENPPAWPAWRQLLPHVLVATDPHRSLTGAAGEQPQPAQHRARDQIQQSKQQPAIIS